MESFEKPDSNSSSAPTSITTSEIPEISTEQLKKEIKLNYLPILSSYQKISIKTKDKKENDKIFDIKPDVNYIDGDSKKSYYVFYNNNLTGLREFYKYELDRLLDKHSIILYYLSDYLKKLDINIENQSNYDPLSMASWLISLANQSTVNKAKTLARNLIAIRDIENTLYGTNLTQNICEVTVSEEELLNGKELFTDLMYDKKFDNNRYLEVEVLLSNLENIIKDHLTYINKLDDIIEKYKEEIGENIVSKEKKLFFSFILNRASYYLSQAVEQLKENFELDLLQKLDKLRRKINYLLLKFRYKYVENERAILGILIDQLKILINTNDIKSIYLEKTQVIKFIRELEKALETKATNLSKERKFEPISIEDIKEIAKLRDVNIASDENIKNSIKDKIEELEEQIDKNKSEIQSISIKYGINSLATISGIPQLNMDTNNKNTKDGNKDEEEGINKILKLNEENNKIQKQITKYKNKIQKINITQNYDIEFVNILKLYFQLIKGNYDSRDDYLGLIITEKKVQGEYQKANKKESEIKEEYNLREYEIKEISKDNKDN